MSYAIVAAGGIGDQLLAFQCASFIRQKYVPIYSCSRDEVYEPLKHFFYQNKPVIQVGADLGENNLFLDLYPNPSERADIKKIQTFDKVYYVTPDGMFCNPMAFDLARHRANPKAIVTKRLLLRRWKPVKRVFCGLSTVEAYKSYKDVGALLGALATRLPEYEIVAPFIRKWGNSSTNAPELAGLPHNVNVLYNADWITVCNYLESSAYGVFIDNGLSHLAYHLGMPRLILDAVIDNIPFIARWREDAGESIPVDTDFKEVARVVETGIRLPQSNLVDRKYVLHPQIDIKRELILKWTTET